MMDIKRCLFPFNESTSSSAKPIDIHSSPDFSSPLASSSSICQNLLYAFNKGEFDMYSVNRLLSAEELDGILNHDDNTHFILDI